MILAAPLVLAAAGVAKLLDRKGSVQSLAEFGVSAGLAPSMGVVAALVELACAVALAGTRCIAIPID